MTSTSDSERTRTILQFRCWKLEEFGGACSRAHLWAADQTAQWKGQTLMQLQSQGAACPLECWQHSQRAACGRRRSLGQLGLCAGRVAVQPAQPPPRALNTRPGFEPCCRHCFLLMNQRVCNLQAAATPLSLRCTLQEAAALVAERSGTRLPKLSWVVFSTSYVTSKGKADMVTLSKKPKLNGHIVQSIKLKAHVTQAGLNCSKRIAYSWSCRQRASLVGAFVLGKLRLTFGSNLAVPGFRSSAVSCRGSFAT